MTGNGNGDKPWPRVVIGMPMERSIPQCGVWSLAQLAQLGYPLFQLPYTRVDVARNQFARDLLKSDFTHILMLDDDHKHPPEIVERLTRWVVQDKTRMVISAFVQRRGEPYDPCMYFPSGDGGLYSPVDFPEGLIQVRNQYGPGWVGTGAVLISREVFEKIPWPWFAYEYTKEDEYPTEDVYFSKKCIEYGIDVWVDTTVECPHLTERFITKELYMQYIAEHPVYVSEAMEAEVLEHGS